MAVSTRNELLQNKAKGYGLWNQSFLVGPGSGTTSAAATSGFHTMQLGFNSIGTTLPGTRVSVLTVPQMPDNALPFFLSKMLTSSRGMWLAYIYKLGTQVLTSTGDQFTHDAATFPILRTIYGQASQAITLIPLINVTTATTTTAPQLVLETVAGGNGYTDQDGNGTRGTKTFIFPAAATAINTCLMLQIENTDVGVQDILAIRTTTAAVAGAADIWGMEPLVPVSTFTGSINGFTDTMFGGMLLPSLKPGVATSGTATQNLCVIYLGSTSSPGAPELYFQAGLVT